MISGPRFSQREASRRREAFSGMRRTVAEDTPAGIGLVG
jgi:hypothetical protein